MPEMALIGYKFKDANEIRPHCELLTSEIDSVTNEMPTLQWCLKLSNKYDAWVACGLAESHDIHLYNSQILVNA
jgi:hypothetical protein